MLRFGVGVLSIIQIDQLNPKAKIIDRISPFPNALAGVPGPVAIFNVLHNCAIFADGIMGANLRVGIIEPIDHSFQIAIRR